MDVLIEASVASALFILGIDEGCYIWLLDEELRCLGFILETMHQLAKWHLVSATLAALSRRVAGWFRHDG